MNNNKTILITSNTAWYLWKFRYGTIEAFVQAGFRVICIAPSDGYEEKFTALGAEFLPIPLDGKSIGPFKELCSLLAVFNLIRRLKPSLVFNFTIKMNIYAGLSCRILGVPYANNVSGLGTVFLHKNWRYSLARWFYGVSNKTARTVFFQNHEDQATFINQGLVAESKAKLLPGSGVNTSDFAFAPLPEALPFTFIMIARLIADKGVREYVAAANIVRKKLAAGDVRFVLIGPAGISNTSAISEQEIQQWHNDNVVEYLGSQDEVRPFIQAAHVMVLPSYREGMPRTILEAASIGRPGLVSDVPGCRQAIKAGETGWLVPAKNAEALADKMLDIVAMNKDELQKIANNARDYAVNTFDEKNVIQPYVEQLVF